MSKRQERIMRTLAMNRMTEEVLGNHQAPLSEEDIIASLIRQHVSTQAAHRNRREGIRKHHQPLTNKHCLMCNATYEWIQKLRYEVWLRDIPHPTVPETREFHDKMQEILSIIDEFLGDKQGEEDAE